MLFVHNVIVFVAGIVVGAVSCGLWRDHAGRAPKPPAGQDRCASRTTGAAVATLAEAA